MAHPTPSGWPGRNCTSWPEMQESWRGTSRGRSSPRGFRRNCTAKRRRMEAKQHASEATHNKKPKPIPGRSWNREDAEKALQAESRSRKNRGRTLIVRFPDPEISLAMIKALHGRIDRVHLQAPLGPRHCFVRLTEDSDVEQVMRDMDNSDFYGLGKLRVERKHEKPEEVVTPEMIDPYTLYVGNLPATVTAEDLRKRFLPSRIDVGFSCRLNFTRYAFVRYQTVEESIEALESHRDCVLGGRNLIVRFRRLKRDPENAGWAPEETALEKMTEGSREQREPTPNLYNILGNFNFGQDDETSEDGEEAEESEVDDAEDDVEQEAT